MRIKSFIFSPFQVNTYLLSDEYSKESILVDCACGSEHEQQVLREYLESEHLIIKYAFNTHLHFDHILGNSWLFAKYGIMPYAHKCDEYCLEWNLSIASFLPLSTRERDFLRFNNYTWFNDDLTFTIGDSSFSVLHNPGHTPGSCSLYCLKKNVLVDGDLLFYHGVGRTDLEMGNEQTIKSSLQSLLLLGEDTLVLPGHGPTTSIKAEKEFIQKIIS